MGLLLKILASFFAVKIGTREFYRSFLDLVQKHRLCCCLGKGTPVLEMFLSLYFPSKIKINKNYRSVCLWQLGLCAWCVGHYSPGNQRLAGELGAVGVWVFCLAGWLQAGREELTGGIWTGARRAAANPQTNVFQQEK